MRSADARAARYPHPPAAICRRSSARARRRIRAIRCVPRPSTRRCRRSRPARTSNDRWSTTKLSEPEASATLTSSTDKAISPNAWPDGRRTEIEVLADHVAHDPLEVDVLGLGGRRYRAIAQHDGVIGDLQRLFEMMRDVDDRDAAAGQVADHLEQHLDFGRAQRGSRLIHDQDARVHRERARNLDDLLLSQAQIFDQRHRDRSLPRDRSSTRAPGAPPQRSRRQLRCAVHAP